MNKVLSFIHLDFITVKPYLNLKNLCIFAGVALFMLVVNSSAGGAIGLVMAFAAIYASYPFAIGEKSNIDVLYTTLSISRNTVVLGRYLFALSLDILAGLSTFVLSFLVLTVMQKGFVAIQALSTIPVMFFVFSVIQAVQLPVYFSLSYAKAKVIAYTPLIVMSSAILLASNFINDALFLDKTVGLINWLAANFMATLVLGVVFWLIIMFVSYKVSVLLYRKRDF
ncbi:MAG: ABC-2 transporter permease [Coriobacteriia bacterium]|nr:ABC-2 transporter permease [Coriobacteriia bacterium]